MKNNRSVVLLIALLFSSLTTAQTTYQWIDKATGRTVYSDQPPPPGVKIIETRGAPATSSEDRQLPFATRQAAQKYPVTLYTAANCTEVCANARALLNGRGVPFTEKLLKTEAEVAEATKLMGNESFLPGLAVGTQRIPGFDSGSWNNLLDLAGYPKTAPYGAKPSGVFAQ